MSENDKTDSQAQAQTQPDAANGVDNAAPEAKETPDKIYTQEQVNELLGRVRSEEKQKLYGRLDKTQAALKAVEAKLSELQEKKAAGEDASVEAKGDKSIPNNAELMALKQENEKLMGQFNELKATYSADIAKFSDILTQTKLESAKKEAMAKYGDELIPELISGDTPEAILASAEASHKKYKAIAEQAAKARQNFPPSDGAKVSTSANPTIEKVLQEMRGLDYATFMEKRDELLRQAFGE